MRRTNLIAIAMRLALSGSSGGCNPTLGRVSTSGASTLQDAN